MHSYNFNYKDITLKEKEEILKKSLIEKAQEELELFYVQIIRCNLKLDLTPIKPLLDELFEKHGKTLRLNKSKYLISQSKVIGYFSVKHDYDNRGHSFGFRVLGGFQGKHFRASDEVLEWVALKLKKLKSE